jgi:hypothetical protein
VAVAVVAVVVWWCGCAARASTLNFFFHQMKESLYSCQLLAVVYSIIMLSLSVGVDCLDQPLILELLTAGKNYYQWAAGCWLLGRTNNNALLLILLSALAPPASAIGHKHNQILPDPHAMFSSSPRHHHQHQCS